MSCCGAEENSADDAAERGIVPDRHSKTREGKSRVAAEGVSALGKEKRAVFRGRTKVR